jgi:hypothetical protein
MELAHVSFKAIIQDQIPLISNYGLKFNLHLTSENLRATRVNQVGDTTPLLVVSILPCPIQVLPDVLGDGIVFHGVEDQQHFCQVTICTTIPL